jgi:hypothetical protein
MEALGIGETQEITERNRLGAKFRDFLGLGIRAKRISNTSTSTMSNTSHITQKLEDRIERVESRGKKIQFYWIPGHCGVEELIRRQSNQSKKAEIVNYYYQWQILKPNGKERQRGN